jgi:hypothetical protein
MQFHIIKYFDLFNTIGVTRKSQLLESPVICFAAERDTQVAGTAVRFLDMH